MTKYFIDLGCNDGVSIRDFAEGYRYDEPDFKDFKLIGFDPLNVYQKKWKKLKSKYNVEFIQAAVWDKNEDLIFNECVDDIASSLMTKSTGEILDSYEVQGIDFAEWLKENIKPEDYVVTKFDIEGAEYVVIPHLIRTGASKLIDKWFIEFHNHKITDDYSEAEKFIRDHISINSHR